MQHASQSYGAPQQQDVINESQVRQVSAVPQTSQSYAVPQQLSFNSQSFIRAAEQDYRTPQQQDGIIQSQTNGFSSQQSVSQQLSQDYSAPQQQSFGSQQDFDSQQNFGQQVNQDYGAPQQQDPKSWPQISGFGAQQLSFGQETTQQYATQQQQSFSSQKNFGSQFKFSQPVNQKYGAPQQQDVISQNQINSPSSLQGFRQQANTNYAAPQQQPIGLQQNFGQQGNQDYGAPQQQDVISPQQSGGPTSLVLSSTIQSGGVSLPQQQTGQEYGPPASADILSGPLPAGAAIISGFARSPSSSQPPRQGYGPPTGNSLVGGPSSVGVQQTSFAIAAQTVNGFGPLEGDSILTGQAPVTQPLFQAQENAQVAPFGQVRNDAAQAVGSTGNYQGYGAPTGNSIVSEEQGSFGVLPSSAGSSVFSQNQIQIGHSSGLNAGGNLGGNDGQVLNQGFIVSPGRDGDVVQNYLPPDGTEGDSATGNQSNQGTDQVSDIDIRGGSALGAQPAVQQNQVQAVRPATTAASVWRCADRYSAARKRTEASAE